MADLVTRRVIEIDTKIAQGALANLKSMDQSVTSLEKTLTSGVGMLKQFAIGFASAFTVGAFVSGIKGAIENMAALNKEVQKVGIEAEALQKLQYSADLANVSSEQLNRSIVALSKNLQDVDTGTSDAAKALRSMGVTGADTAESALMKVATAFKDMPDGARKAALAVNALGKGAQDLIPWLNQGADGLKAMGEEAEQLGLIISGQALQAADDFSDTLSKIQKTGAGAFAQMAQGMLPALQAISNAFLDVVKNGQTFVSVGETIGKAALWITEQFIKAGAAVEALGKLMGGLAAAAAQVAGGEFKLAARIMKETIADIDALGENANKRIAKLNADYQAAIKKMQDPAKPRPVQKIGEGSAAAVQANDAITNSLKKLEQQAIEANVALGLFEGGVKLDRVKQMADILADIEKGLGRKMSFDESVAAIERLTAAMEELEGANKMLADARKSQENDAKRAIEFEQMRQDAIRESEASRAAAFDAEQDRLKKLRDNVQDLVDPLHTVREQMGEIREAMLQDEIAWNDGARALEVLSQKLDETGDHAKELADDFKKDLLDAINGFSRQASEAIVDFASGAKGSFTDMAKSILHQLAVMTVQAMVVAPLFKSLTGYFGFEQGGVFAGGQLVPFARGGVVTQPTIFPFAQGIGLMGEAGPEAIMPLTRTAGGDLGVKASGAPVNVTIINNSSAKATTSSEKRADGGVDLRIMVEDTVERGFATGRFDQTLSSNYGVARRGRN